GDGSVSPTVIPVLPSGADRVLGRRRRRRKRWRRRRERRRGARGLAGCEGGAADDVGRRGGEGGQGGRRCTWHVVDRAPGSPEPGALPRDNAGRAGRG
ncbi:unnamed protein product, partial [Ectocarpus sp. 6 AP-2014]